MKHIAYGADYNPEQWPDETVDDDIALMREADVTMVTVGVFAWAKLQPRPGVFDFAWLDQLLDKLHAAGIQVDLGTATASPPAWLGALHPETLPVTADGVRLGHGSRQAYNPSSAVFRREVETMARAVAQRYAAHPAVVMWHVHNEYACHVSESFDEESAERFRRWLRAKYVTLDALNEAWGTAFWAQGVADWSHIQPPRAMPTLHNPHAALDWRRFSSDVILELFTLERDIIREYSSDQPITTNFMGAFDDLDYWRWAEEIDVISNDLYPDPADPRSARDFAFASDLMRSLGGGAPFLQLEQSPSAVQWRERNASKRPGQFRLWSLQTVARGADGICQFQWRQSRAGAETFHAGMVPHAGRDSVIWNDVVTLGGDLARLGSVAGTRVDAKLAIVWEWQSAWANRAAIGLTDSDPLAVARDWHASAFEAGYQADFVRPGADLGAYDLVIVPALFAVTAATAEWLDAAVRRGAVVLATARTGVVDAQGHAHLGGYLGPLVPTAGVRVTDQFARAAVPARLADEPARPERLNEIDEGADRITGQIGAPSACATVPFSGSQKTALSGTGVGWLERLLVDDAEVVARFDDVDAGRWPAVTRAERGRGAFWYVATDPDAASRARLLARVSADAGVEPVLEGLPPGVEAVRRGQHLFLLNHGDDPQDVRVPRGRTVIGPEPHEGCLHLPPREVAVIESYGAGEGATV